MGVFLEWRDFNIRFGEHKRAFKYNTNQSKFAKHLLEQRHSFGNIEDTMEIVQFHKKGTHLNTIQRYYIRKESIKNNHLNEDYTDKTNHIFNTILENTQISLQ
jgi:hypothetical protein